ncbi:hypothetical protein ABG79_02194 [Caloramator mitchellensis]|uniref:Uncharacterized protein n=1 Tax=Caloramator mitchellensis TaxID=908809 RepID=A0A0R3JXX8_CALMK|nr:hypothetical protein [Caloramator mitchellensis]KRQ86062.1 hypothetical protein ABG79_02194 [Caloramator mitchellensis]
MSWLEPKINWTSEDYYNAEDLNRVENNIKELETIFKTLNPNFTLFDNVVTNRNYAHIEFVESLNRIEDLINSIRNAFTTTPNFIEPKTNWQHLDSFSYIDANRLEQNLKDLYEYINKAIDNLQYCGTVNCGDDTRIF